MASVKSANKETLSRGNYGKEMEEEMKKLTVKEEVCLAKEGGKKQEIRKANAIERVKMTEKESIANKEVKVEVGPEEFLKHPLQVTLANTEPNLHVTWPECLDSVVLQE